MQLEHTFSVPAPVDDVWRALTDPQRVAPCMPGATLTSVEDNDFAGSVKVKLGPVALLYKGKGTFVETDDQAHRLVIKAGGKDSRGNGTANATVTVTLTDRGGSTDGTVSTDLSITGKPAQFGRGMISDVGGKILEKFTECLSDKLASAQATPAPAAEATATTAAPAAPAPASPAPAPTPNLAATNGHPLQAAQETEPLDLMQYARGSLLKRAAPVAGAVALVALLLVALRVLRGSSDG